MRILIVSGDADETREFLEDLEDLKHEIFIVHDGARAMEILKQNSPDVALVCSSLPDMTGMELCRWRKEQEQELARGFTHIILAFCGDDDANPLEAVKAGAEDYIFLPLSEEKDLAARVYLAERDIMLREEIVTDPLTRVLNRRGFKAAFNKELMRANREESCLALVVVDIDKLKTINDTWGHAAGDEVLVAAAHLLRESVRSYEFVARLGGDEFAVLLLNGPDEEDVLRWGKRVSDVIKEQLTITAAPNVRIKVSIGVALSEPADRKQRINPLPIYRELLEKADAAMYRAKKSRRSKVQMAK